MAYETVIVDTPALSAVSDGLMVAAHTDGSLLVVAANGTDESDARKAVDQLKLFGIDNVLGVVVNKDVVTISDYDDYFVAHARTDGGIGVNGVTVVIPAYNEGPGLADALMAVATYFASHGGTYEFSYLIVDDGSNDNTYAVAEAFARRWRRVRVLRHQVNRGLGAALRTAFDNVCTEIAVVLDADLSYSPATAMKLIEALAIERADIALASPYALGGSVLNVPGLRRVFSREANRFLSLATNGRYATLTCMVRAYRVAALRRLDFRGDRMVGHRRDAVVARCGRTCGSSKFPQPLSGATPDATAAGASTSPGSHPR